MTPAEYIEDDFWSDGDYDYRFDDYGDTDIMEEEIEATYEGEDAIEIARQQGEKLEFGFSFHAHEGDEGDETEDTGDLPENMKHVGNRYDSNLALGGVSKHDSDEIIEGMHFADGGDIGFAFGPDDYVNDEDEEHY